MPKLTRRSLLRLMTTLTLLLTTSSCIDLEDGSPRIASLTITPSTITRSSQGMTDQYFEITIVTENFTEPLESAQVFIQDLNREATQSMAPQISGDTITIKNVAFAWFTGVPVGEHAISASVFSQGDLQTATELNLATVTITED